MANETNTFDWSDFAYGSKKPLRDLRATLILAPRTMSSRRIKMLLKQYLPHGNIVFGIAKEPFVEGFDGQRHFATLPPDVINPIIHEVSSHDLPHKLCSLLYFQRETDQVIEKIRPSRVLIVRGSYHHAFHTTSTFYILTRLGIPYTYLSPFTDEEAESFQTVVVEPVGSGDEKEILAYAKAVATQSADYSYQTGCVLAQKSGKKYTVVASGYNQVIPYQGYAMHHGNSREDHMSPSQDTNHYDTIHAEMKLMVDALEQKKVLSGLTMFINTLPCPNCARTLSQTRLAEVIYENDHSDGYAIKLFEQCNIKTRRIVL